MSLFYFSSPLKFLCSKHKVNSTGHAMSIPHLLPLSLSLSISPPLGSGLWSLTLSVSFVLLTRERTTLQIFKYTFSAVGVWVWAHPVLGVSSYRTGLLILGLGLASIPHFTKGN